MNQNLEKFVELLKTDDALQAKFRSAVENYTGEQTLEAVFQNLILPAADEAGCPFSWEDYQEFVDHMNEDVKNLNLDEMNQVAGGTWGVGFGACNTGGIGVGGSGDFVCAVIGAGSGAGVCFVKGASIDDK